MKPSQATSKIGTIDFSYFDDNGRENRGWVVDKVVASLDGVEVGYLKISYIPKSNFEKFYPNIISFLNRIKGWMIKPYIESNTLEYIKSIVMYYNTNLRNEIDRDKEHLKYNEEWAKQYLETLTKDLESIYGREFREFKDYMMDTPLVDYIKVEEKYIGTGIGYGLYIAGSKWMAEKHMCLYASGVQSKGAHQIWMKMEKSKELPIKKKSFKWGGRTIIRKCLDYR